MFLIATYSPKPKQGYGAVTSGCFSADGQYFYYTLYGSATESRCSLWRYDLARGETELCYCESLSSNDYHYYDYPSLVQVGEEAFLCLWDTSNSSDIKSVLLIRKKDGEWGLESFPGSAAYRIYFAIYQTGCYGSYAISYGSAAGLGAFVFQRYSTWSTDALAEDLQRYLGICNQSQTVRSLSADELTAQLQDMKDGDR